MSIHCWGLGFSFLGFVGLVLNGLGFKVLGLWGLGLRPRELEGILGFYG